MYGRLRDPNKAREWFEKSRKRDLFLYNAMLQAYVDSENWSGVHELFHLLTSEGNIAPDHITFKIFFKALLMQGKFTDALNIYEKHIRLVKTKLLEGNYKEMFKWLKLSHEAHLQGSSPAPEKEQEACNDLHMVLSEDSKELFSSAYIA